MSFKKVFMDSIDNGKHGKPLQYGEVIGLVRVAKAEQPALVTTDPPGGSLLDFEGGINGGYRLYGPGLIGNAVFIMQGTQAIGWPLESVRIEPFEVKIEL